MTSLLRTTALASVLALAAPHALANEAKNQADYDANAQTQSFEAGAAAGAEPSATDATAAGNVDLMAQFERLRMLDTIGDVEVVKLEAGELPRSSASAAAAAPTTGAATGVDAQPMDPAAPETASDDLAASELDSAAEDRISSGFEAGGTAPAPDSEAAEFDTAAEAAAEADTRFKADDQAQLGVTGGTETETEETQAGALFDETDQGETGQGQAGMEPDANQEMAADSGDWHDPGESAASGGTAASGELSATFIEDTVSQMPEISAALEEADAEPGDIVQMDIGDNGDVTIYVR